MGHVFYFWILSLGVGEKEAVHMLADIFDWGWSPSPRFNGTTVPLFFVSVNLAHPENVSSEHVDLSRASLIGTDRSRVRLAGID